MTKIETSRNGRIEYPCASAAYSAIRRGNRSIRRKAEPKRFCAQLSSHAHSPDLRSAALSALRWSAAPIAVIAASSPAAAQDACSQVGPDNFECENLGAPAVTTQDVSGGSITIALEDGFDVDTTVTGGNALDAGSIGSLTIRQTSGTSTLTGDTGILAVQGGAGDVSIITGGAVTGTAGTGVYAYSSVDSGTVTIDTSAGTVTGSRSGITAIHYGDGALRIETADVIGESASGIYANNVYAGGTLTIDSSAGSVSGATAGISVYNYAATQLSITTGDVSSSAGSGILAASSGSTVIDSTGGSVTGASSGINARNNGAGALAITTADVSGADAQGIVATGDGAGVTIDTSAGSVSGGTFGIEATNRGSGTLSITTADVTGSGNDAIAASNSAGSAGLLIDSSAGTVAGEERGIDARNYGSAELAITTGDVTGAAASGIYAYNSTNAGDLTIDSSAGTVTGQTSAIAAINYGNGAVAITTGDASATNAQGVYAYNSETGTSLAIDTSAGRIVGETAGIGVNNRGSGSLEITSGDVTGNQGAGLDLINAAGADGVTITVDGAVAGATSAVRVSNDGASGTSILNNGALSAASGQALDISGNAVTVTNNGTINGFVALTANDDEFTNSGTFSAAGDSDFGGGNDVLNNTGTLAITGAAPVRLAGLETFNNAGTVSLADGAAGGNLVIAGDFAGSEGASIELDIDFGNNVADVVTINGAASGATAIRANLVGDGPDGLFSTIRVVDAGDGSAADAFVIEGEGASSGLVQFGLAFDAANNDYLLASAPSGAARETTAIAESARATWQRSSDAWSQQMMSQRDTGGSERSNAGGDAGVGGWVTAYGGELERDRTVAASFNGISNTFDLGYDQNFIGLLAGLDYGSEILRFGVTGGLQHSEVGFAGSPNSIEYDVLTLGAYAALNTGPFFANVLAKYDMIDGDLDSVSGGFASEVDGSAYGVTGSIGALLGDQTGFFFEPSAELSWANVDLDPITAPQGSFAFDEADSLLGKVGARVGTGFDLGGAPGSVFVGGRYVHEFEGEDGVIFASGTQSVGFGNTAIGDYGEANAGLSVGNADDTITGTLAGQYIKGEDIEGYGASVSVRMKF